MAAPPAYARKIRMSQTPFPSDRLYPFRVMCSLCPGLSLPAANMTEINMVKGEHRTKHWLDNDPPA